MQRIATQAWKELTQFGRDKITVGLAIILPVAAFLLFGYGVRLEERNIPVVVQDLDNSPLSRSIVERLVATDQLSPVPRTECDPIAALDRGDAQAAIVIPSGFSRQFVSGMKPSIQVLIDGTDVNNARVIKNSIVATTDFFLRTLKPNQAPPLVNTETRIWFNPGRKEALYIVPGSLAFVLWIFPSLLASFAIVREKEQGTILQAYTSSISAAELIAGKAIAYLIVGIAEALTMGILGAVLFGLRFAGDPIFFTLATVTYLMVSVLFGLAVGSGTDTQTAAVQAVAGSGFTTSLLLSGFIYPIRNIKFPFSYVSYLIPARHFLILARNAFVRGGGWDVGWLELACLLVFAVVLFARAHQTWSRMQLEA
ncbi:MAG TPA: ABC transporter permease [Oculatellaceae cyanobacterium]